MKWLHYFALSFFPYLISPLTTLEAQQRYIDEIFTEVDVTYDITYGVNATVLYFSVVGEAIPEELKMDVYEPANDDLEERPLIILAHTGNFFPQPDFCEVTGRRDEEFMTDMAMRLARMGYVVAVIDYRYGWNPAAVSQDERIYTLINAIYRGIQDLRTCIRYFKKDAAENGNTYGVDVNKITAMGDGTGGYITLATASLDDYLEIILPQFIFDIGGTSVPMVLESINGDIYGTSTGIAPAGMAFPEGDTLCYPNHPGYESDFQLAVNFGGALADSSWIDENTVPTISFQNPYDPYDPYMEDFLVIHPGGLIIEVQGAYIVQAKMAELGINNVFASQTWTDDYSTRANMLNDGFDGLFPLPNGPEVNATGDSVIAAAPWHWWNPADWTGEYCAFLMPPNDPDMATYAALSDPGMTPERGQAYTDTLIAYFAPRACLVLDLGCDLSDYIITDTKGDFLQKDQTGLNISPNPATDEVVFSTFRNFLMQDVLLYDAQGRLVNNWFEINDNHFTLKRGEMPAGMYIARIRFEEGTVAAKVVFK